MQDDPDNTIFFTCKSWEGAASYNSMSKEILIIKHIEVEGPGTIGHFFQNTRWLISTVNLSSGDVLPDRLGDIKAIITLGGPMNVYEESDHPFLRDEDIFLKNALQKEIPVFGICLGAQLLAKACGARVRKAPKKEIGWHKIGLTPDGNADPLFSGLPDKMEVFQWHEDTFDIPDGGVHLAASASCPNQAFRVGKNAYGFQFHIEVTPAIIGSWVDEYVKGDRSFAVGNMVIDAHKNKEIFEKQADAIYRNFERLIQHNHP